MKFPSFYDWASPPEAGYEDVRVRVLLNPSKGVWADYGDGGTEPTAVERQLRAMNEEILGLSQATEQERQQARERIAELDQALAERRRKLARSFHALYGETPVSEGWDFSSPDAALATIEQDGIPDEVIYWLFRLPSEIVNRRRTELSKNLAASFETSAD